MPTDSIYAKSSLLLYILLIFDYWFPSYTGLELNFGLYNQPSQLIPLVILIGGRHKPWSVINSWNHTESCRIWAWSKWKPYSPPLQLQPFFPPPLLLRRQSSLPKEPTHQDSFASQCLPKVSNHFSFFINFFLLSTLSNPNASFWFRGR